MRCPKWCQAHFKKKNKKLIKNLISLPDTFFKKYINFETR